MSKKIEPKMISSTRVRTCLVRIAFPNLFEPRKNDDGTPGKYDCCLLIDKEEEDTIKYINKAIEAAKAEGVTSRWNGKMPSASKLQTPLNDGDEKEDDQYSGTFDGMMYINPKSKSRPAVADIYKNMLQEDDIKSGDYVLATMSFYPYDFNGKKGIGASLDNIVKVKNGPSLAGKPSLESDFEDLNFEDMEDDEDDDI